MNRPSYSSVSAPSVLVSGTQWRETDLTDNTLRVRDRLPSSPRQCLMCMLALWDFRKRSKFLYPVEVFLLILCFVNLSALRRPSIFVGSLLFHFVVCAGCFQVQWPMKGYETKQLRPWTEKMRYLAKDSCLSCVLWPVAVLHTLIRPQGTYHVYTCNL